MTATDRDFTGKIGDLFASETPPEWPMFSFSRAAHLFWNGFANGLAERGLSDEQIQAELQSKGARWLLNGDGQQLEDLGRKMAAVYELSCS